MPCATTSNWWGIDSTGITCTSAIASDPAATEIPNNGIDDDDDGFVDCNDLDCVDECTYVEICDNGVDDDGDSCDDCSQNPVDTGDAGLWATYTPSTSNDGTDTDSPSPWSPFTFATRATAQSTYEKARALFFRRSAAGATRL